MKEIRCYYDQNFSFNSSLNLKYVQVMVRLHIFPIFSFISRNDNIFARNETFLLDITSLFSRLTATKTKNSLVALYEGQIFYLLFFIYLKLQAGMISLKTPDDLIRIIIFFWKVIYPCLQTKFFLSFSGITGWTPGARKISLNTQGT